MHSFRICIGAIFSMLLGPATGQTPRGDEHLSP
jgi:hypothetical protein